MRRIGARPTQRGRREFSGNSARRARPPRRRAWRAEPGPGVGPVVVGRRGEMPRASAASSTVRPAKKRSLTSSALRRSSASSAVRASSRARRSTRGPSMAGSTSSRSTPLAAARRPWRRPCGGRSRRGCGAWPRPPRRRSGRGCPSPGRPCADQPEVGLVDQGRGLERLARLLLRQPLGGELAQLVVDQGQELLGRLGVALLDGREDVGHVVHGARELASWTDPTIGIKGHKLAAGTQR